MNLLTKLITMATKKTVAKAEKPATKKKPVQMGLGGGKDIIIGDIADKETTTVTHADGTTVTFPANKILLVKCETCDGRGTVLSGSRICSTCNGACEVEEKY